MPFYTVTFSIPAPLDDAGVPLFLQNWEERVLSIASAKEKGGWNFLLTLDYEPDTDALKQDLLDSLSHTGLRGPLRDFITAELEDKDWLAESYRSLPAFTIGPFYIFGSHWIEPTPQGLIPLQIDAATAFGSGSHGTTAGCLQALADLKENGFLPKKILDMGCGSGILALAAQKLWPQARVVAADNDPECIRVTARHAEANHETIEMYISEGYEPKGAVLKSAPYDLVIANILARPLIDMAEDQSAALAKDGRMILSGLLQTQEDEVKAAYKATGLDLLQRYPVEEWMALVLAR